MEDIEIECVKGGALQSLKIINNLKTCEKMISILQNECNNNSEQIKFIKKIVQVYNDKLFKNDLNIKKIINVLPSFMAYTLETIIKNYQINKINPSSDIIKLNFINDYLNDEFNTGCWRDVDINKRIAFSISSCFKVIFTVYFDKTEEVEISCQI